MNQDSRLAIITPYHKEKRDVLERCIASVKGQTVPVAHLVVSDGFPQDWLDSAGIRHIRLGQEHHDYGNTPRGIGALLAVSEGYEGIGLLDADNWYESRHVEECCRAADSGTGTAADLVIAKRRIVLSDGTRTNFLEEPGHVDTNCYWFLAGSFHLLHHWVIMPRRASSFGDRVFHKMVQAQRLTTRYTEEITVNYTSDWESHYRICGKTPPPGAKGNVNIFPALEWLRSLDRHQQQLVNNGCGCDLLLLANELSGARSVVTRNGPCPCGSGKRYKHCHGAQKRK
jgi:hypothetical protein